MRKVISVFTLITILISFSLIEPIIIYAEKDLDEVRKEREDIKQEVKASEKKIKQLIQEIEEKTIEIAALNETLAMNEENLKEVRKEIDDVNKEINRLNKRIDERFELLKDRVRSYQEAGGNISYVEVLLGSKNFSQFLSRVHAVSKITESDAALIEEQEKDRDLVEENLAELEALQIELEDHEQLILEQKERAEEMKKELEEKTTELENLIEELKAKDKNLVKKEFKIISSYDLSKTKSSFSVNNIDGSGILAWPTEGGYISSHVGMRWGRVHKGMDIARTDRSTKPPIYAAKDGIVETATFNNGGYGNMVIINHGDGIKTLYAHMDSLSVSSGDKVSQGDKLGIMGATGDSTGIHLHLEVHVNGEAKNPIFFF